MPGKVLRVNANPGDSVVEGQAGRSRGLKMEHAIAAPRDGVVASVLVEEGELVFGPGSTFRAC